MISKRYVIASADPEFVGPLAPGYLGHGKRYLSRFGFSFPERSRPKGWDESKGIEELSIPRNPPKVHDKYSSNPSEAMLFDRVEADLASFILNGLVDKRSYAFSVEESHAFEHSLVH